MSHGSMIPEVLSRLFVNEGDEQAGAGPSMADQQGFYSGNDVSVPDASGGGPGSGSDVFLSWDSLDAGIELLDRTDPIEPSVLVDGIYAVTVVIECSDAPITAGGGLHGTLHLDHNGLDAVNEDTFAARADGRILRSISCALFISAGGTIALTVRNFDGGPVDHDMRIREAVIQRIS